ncbi:MAG: hypothetical protein DMG47_15510 [Acidobacteria bacterium]|nr:MAG: hypothetical protein DMG47_15510 [Acidobacteriota bacterium]
MAAPLVQSGAGALRPTHFRRYRFGSQTTVHRPTLFRHDELDLRMAVSAISGSHFFAGEDSKKGSAAYVEMRAPDFWAK